MAFGLGDKEGCINVFVGPSTFVCTFPGNTNAFNQTLSHTASTQKDDTIMSFSKSAFQPLHSTDVDPTRKADVCWLCISESRFLFVSLLKQEDVLGRGDDFYVDSAHSNLSIISFSL